MDIFYGNFSGIVKGFDYKLYRCIRLIETEMNTAGTR